MNKNISAFYFDDSVENLELYDCTIDDKNEQLTKSKSCTKLFSLTHPTLMTDIPNSILSCVYTQFNDCKNVVEKFYSYEKTRLVKYDDVEILFDQKNIMMYLDQILTLFYFVLH